MAVQTTSYKNKLFTITVADYWHEKILPQHFKKDAGGKYDYARRSSTYLKQKSGKPDLIFRGKHFPNLKREIKSITQDEIAAVAAVVEAELARLYNSLDKSGAVGETE